MTNSSADRWRFQNFAYLLLAGVFLVLASFLVWRLNRKNQTIRDRCTKQYLRVHAPMMHYFYAAPGEETQK